jgi:hypothetical protein
VKIDLERLLREHRIQTKKQTRNALNICCPYCPDEDTGYHCGLFLDGSNFHCWKCGASGSLDKILSKILPTVRFEKQNLHFRANSIDSIREILSRNSPEELRVRVSLPPQTILIDDSSVRKFPVVLNYLNQRRITVEDCMKRGVGFCITGELRYRLIIPIYSSGVLVAYQSRLMVPCSRVPKYLTSSEVPISNYLYGFDSLRSRDIVVVEGVFDQWPLDGRGVACFGSFLSSRQRALILSRFPDSVVFCFDPDIFESKHKVEKLRADVDFLLSLDVCVRIAKLPKGEDPASLGVEVSRFVEEAEVVREPTFSG